jgi:integration host factor subunit beta
LKTITEDDFAQLVAKATGTGSNLAKRVVDVVFNVMREALTEEDRIEIRGFGVVEKAARPKPVARNPRTGEIVKQALRQPNSPLQQGGLY